MGCLPQIPQRRVCLPAQRPLRLQPAAGLRRGSRAEEGFHRPRFRARVRQDDPQQVENPCKPPFAEKPEAADRILIFMFF